MNDLIFGLIADPLFSSSATAQPVTYSGSRVRVDSVQVVANRAPEKAIDRLTDFIFYNLHPELNRRKIRSDETQYINEWPAIKKWSAMITWFTRMPAVETRRITTGCFPNMTVRAGKDREELSLYPVLCWTLVVDAVLYTRHSELDYRRIQPSETRLVSEWSKIRHEVSSLHPCY